jgi:hypothetical protein
MPVQLLRRAIRGIGIVPAGVTGQKLEGDARIGEDASPAWTHKDAVRCQVAGYEAGIAKGVHRGRDTEEKPERAPDVEGT